jgi:hypothetical protein
MIMNQEKLLWMKDLLDKDSRIMGVYLALLCLRFLKRDDDYTDAIPSGKDFINRAYYSWDRYYIQYFGKNEIEEAIEAGEAFIDRLFEHERVLNSASRNLILDLIERDFYYEFSSAFKKYLKLDLIIPEFRQIIQNLLQDVIAGSYKIIDETLSGSRLVEMTEDDLKKYGIRKIGQLILGSGFAIGYANYYIFPAPSLSEDTIHRLTDLQLR